MKIGDIVVIVNELPQFNGKEVEIVQIDENLISVKFDNGKVRTGYLRFFVPRDYYNSPLYKALEEEGENEIITNTK